MICIVVDHGVCVMADHGVCVMADHGTHGSQSVSQSRSSRSGVTTWMTQGGRREVGVSLTQLIMNIINYTDQVPVDQGLSFGIKLLIMITLTKPWMTEKEV